jgi:hypothetical protein
MCTSFMSLVSYAYLAACFVRDGECGVIDQKLPELMSAVAIIQVAGFTGEKFLTRSRPGNSAPGTARAQIHSRRGYPKIPEGILAMKISTPAVVFLAMFHPPLKRCRGAVGQAGVAQ